jgi:hypothetical protein
MISPNERAEKQTSDQRFRNPFSVEQCEQLKGAVLQMCCARSVVDDVGATGRCANCNGDGALRVTSIARNISQLVEGSLDAPVGTEKLNPRVVMVKSAQDGVRTYETGSLNRPRIRRIFV